MGAGGSAGDDDAKEAASPATTDGDGVGARRLTKDEKRRAKEEKRSRALNRHKQAVAEKLAAEADPDEGAAATAKWEQSVIAL